jgi:hypothetical protein
MPAKNSVASPTSAQPSLAQEPPVQQRYAATEELIRAKAFQLYEERGSIDGHAEEDWLQAECEILSRKAGKAAA